MRKLTFGGAISLDNFIARKDDAVDWLMFSDEAGAIMGDHWAKIDTILMGRKIYKFAMQHSNGKENADQSIKTYIFSRNLKQAEAVKECFHFHRRRYGSRRIAKDVGIGRYLARWLMREQNLVAIQPKSFVPKTTNSKHGFRISPNLLKDNQREVNLKGQAIVGDITYLGLRNGKFCYLATFQDKYTRRIVGWAIMAEISEITIEKRVGIMSVGDFITNTYEVKRKLDSLGITPVQFYNSVESLKIDSNSPQSLFIIKDKSVKDILNQLIGESNLKYWTIIRWGNDGEFISIVVS